MQERAKIDYHGVDNAQIFCRCIEAIPNEWELIRGILYAPKTRYLLDKVAANTRRVYRWDQMPSCVVVGHPDLPYELMTDEHNRTLSQILHLETPPDPAALESGKRPSSIEFQSKSGYNLTGELSIITVKEAMTALTQKGYMGDLEALCSDGTCTMKILPSKKSVEVHIQVNSESHDDDPERTLKRDIRQIERMCNELRSIGLTEEEDPDMPYSRMKLNLGSGKYRRPRQMRLG